MKNTKKNILSKLALLTLITTFSGIKSQDISPVIIDTMRAEFIAPMLDTFRDFFDSSITTPFNTFIIHIENLKRQHNSKLANFETTISETEEQSPLAGMCVAFGHQIQPKFNKIFNILKKYNGKKADQATAFSNELMSEFDAELMFKEITAQLSTLFAQAKAEDNKQLMKAINDLVLLLKNKKAEMSKKSDKISLFTGIITRMRA